MGAEFSLWGPSWLCLCSFLRSGRRQGARGELLSAGCGAGGRARVRLEAGTDASLPSSAALPAPLRIGTALPEAPGCPAAPPFPESLAVTGGRGEERQPGSQTLGDQHSQCGLRQAPPPL